jgi:hypothetical protein
MRFVWLLVMVASLLFAFMTRHPGVLAVCLFVGFVSGLCAVFSFAAARIESTSRPDSALLTPEVLAAVRARAAAQQQQRGPAAPPQALPPAPAPRQPQ